MPTIKRCVLMCVHNIHDGDTLLSLVGAILIWVSQVFTYIFEFMNNLVLEKQFFLVILVFLYVCLDD